MSYDKKFREQVMSHISKGHSKQATAKLFGLGKNTITDWEKLQEETGGLSNRELNRQGRKIEAEKLRSDVEKYPEDFNWERAKRFDCTEEAIRVAMKANKLTRKKRQ